MSKLDDTAEALNENTISAFSTHRQQLQCATMHVLRCLIVHVVISISDRPICLKYLRSLRFANRMITLVWPAEQA